MPLVGQSSSADQLTSPGNDGGGGVPQNSVINNVTNLANAIAADVSGTFRAINAPPGTPVQTGSFSVGQSGGTLGSIGLIPLLLIFAAGWLIFRG
jgi:hypothetical protein